MGLEQTTEGRAQRADYADFNLKERQTAVETLGPCRDPVTIRKPAAKVSIK
jgi:hypothetical protein